jgi:hypothetical protein
MAEAVHQFGKLREAVGVFDDEKTLVAAIDELRRSGFDRSEISLLAGENTIEQKLGHRLRSVTEAEDDPKAPTVAYVSPETFGDIEGWLIGALLYVGALGAAGAVVATGGTLGAILLATGASGAVGATIGSLAAHWIDQHHAEYIAEQIDRGGLLLWVRAWDPEREKKATTILSRHSAHDVHVHELRHRG